MYRIYRSYNDEYMILRGAFCLGSFSLRLSTKYQKYFEKLSLLSAFIKWFAFIALHKQFIPQLPSYTFPFPFVTVKCIICLSFVLCPHCLLSIEWNSARLGDPAHAKQIINCRQNSAKGFQCLWRKDLNLNIQMKIV